MKTLSSKAFALPGVVLGTTLLLASCSSGIDERSKAGLSAISYADSVSGLIQGKAPAILKHDTAHAFVRRADICFRVKDVVRSTSQLEDIVRAHQGYVTCTNLESHISSFSSTRLSADTMMDVTNYTVENNLTIRVPNNQLDTVLKEITGLAGFMDHRKITAEDVKLQLLANRLSEARFAKHRKRFEAAIDQQGKKLPQTTAAEDELAMKESSADGTRIRTMSLLEDVSYSTLSLKIYQPATQRTERYAYVAPVKPYEPGFGSRLLTAATDSGHVFAELLLFLVKLWPLAIVAIGVVVLVKWIVKLKVFGS